MEGNRRHIALCTPNGSHGSFTVSTCQCLSVTIDALKKHVLLSDLFSSTLLIGSLHGKAYVDESVVEGSFGLHPFHGVNRSRSMAEYGHGKHYEVRAHIRRICRNNFSFYVGLPKFYNPTESCNVDADTVLRVEREIFERILKSNETHTPQTSGLGVSVTRSMVQDLEGLCKYLRAQPTQTVRDKYRKVIGFAPQIIVQHENGDPGCRQLDQFHERVRRLMACRRQAFVDMTAHQFVGYEGDVVIIRADVEWIDEQRERQVDPWQYWLFELLEPIKANACGAMCYCSGVWFDIEELDEDGMRWFKHSFSQRLRIGKLILDELNNIVVLPWEMVRTRVGSDGEALFGVKMEFDDILEDVVTKRAEALRDSETGPVNTDSNECCANETEDADSFDEVSKLKQCVDATVTCEDIAGKQAQPRRRVVKKNGVVVSGYKALTSQK